MLLGASSLVLLIWRNPPVGGYIHKVVGYKILSKLSFRFVLLCMKLNDAPGWMTLLFLPDPEGFDLVAGSPLSNSAFFLPLAQGRGGYLFALTPVYILQFLPPGSLSPWVQHGGL